MKTHLVFLLILLLVAAAIVVDSHRLDAAGLFFTVAVAAVFAVAHGDAAPRRRPLQTVRPSAPRAPSSAAWAEQKACVLCAAVSS